MTDEELNAPSYLIFKRGYYYRPNEQGYTSSAIQAGRYTLTEAEKITHPNGVYGPRDGMTFIHEDEVNDEDWKTYTTLRAQLAEARAERDVWEIDAKRNHQAAEIEFARADRAEAALAAQIEVDAGLLQTVADNWSCGCANSWYCRCAEAAEQWGYAADAIRAQPHDRAALDRYREKVLREVLEKAKASFYGVITQDAILALIEKPNAR